MLGQQSRAAAVAIATVLLVPGATAARAADALPVLEGKISLGAVTGRIDHLAIDLPRKRLLVAELGNNSVAVVDVAKRQLVRRIEGLHEPQGLAYAAKADLILVANAGDGSVDLFHAGDLSRAGKQAVGSDADNVRVDGPDRMMVGYGDGGLAVLDAASGKKLADIPLPAHPEAFLLDPDGHRVYVNLPAAHRVAVVDRTNGKTVAQWAPDAGGNFPMALDPTGSRLFVGFRAPASIGMFDTRTGKPLGRVPTCGDADDVFFDARRQRLYVSCGEGFLAVLNTSGTTLAELSRIPTRPGARTSLFVPSVDRLFVAVRANGAEPAKLWVFRLP